MDNSISDNAALLQELETLQVTVDHLQQDKEELLRQIRLLEDSSNRRTPRTPRTPTVTVVNVNNSHPQTKVPVEMIM